MKKLLLPIILLSAYCAHGQADYDSLKEKILRMDVAISNIHFNMRAANSEFRTGTIALGIGVLVTGIGAHLYASNKAENPTAMYAGLVVIGFGSVMHISSHGWIGRGAWKKRGLYD